jgi:tRNA pseudouridine synthase 10
MGRERTGKTYRMLSGHVPKFRCLVWLSRTIIDDDLRLLNRTVDLTINQKTPIRVLHRRSLATRSRTIFVMQANQISQHVLLLRLETQAGT